MKKHLTIMFAVLCTALCALSAAETKPAPPAPETITVDAYNKLKAERDAAQNAAATVPLLRQQIEHLGVLSERNEYAFRLAVVDLTKANQTIEALRKELEAAKATPPAKPETSKK